MSSPASPLPSPARRRACLISPSRSLIYSLEFIAKVYCVARTVYESVDLVDILGTERVLRDCGLLILDMRPRGRRAPRDFLRDLVHSGLSDGLEIVALSDTPQAFRYPGVTEIRTTTAEYQLNVIEFDRILSRWKHVFAQTSIQPAYRALLDRAQAVRFRIEGVHHFWQKLAVLDADPLFREVVRFVALRMGYTFVAYERTIDLVRDIASGVPFAHVVVDQAFEFSAAGDIDPSDLLQVASLAIGDDSSDFNHPTLTAFAQKVPATTWQLHRNLRAIRFHSVHDQITRILPPIEHIGEIDRMYPSNPLLVNITDVARKLDREVKVTTQPADHRSTGTPGAGDGNERDERRDVIG